MATKLVVILHFSCHTLCHEEDKVCAYCRKKNCEMILHYRTESVQDIPWVIKYSTYDHLHAVIKC